MSLSWQDFLQDTLNEGLKGYAEVSKVKAESEAEKYRYLQTVPKNTADPNAHRETEPVKGQDSDGSTIVGIPYREYGGLPLWAWGGMAATFLIIILVIVLSSGRRRG